MLNRNRALLGACMLFIISATCAADDTPQPEIAVIIPSVPLSTDEKVVPIRTVMSEVGNPIPTPPVIPEADKTTNSTPVTTEADKGTHSTPTTGGVDSTIQTPSVICDCEKIAPTPPATPVIEVPSLKKANALLVDQKIELFRKTMKETTQEKGMLSRLFSSTSNPIDAELHAEMLQFTESYAGLPQTDEVFHLLAQLNKRTKNYPAAALDWMLLKVMYPQSSFVSAANKQLKELTTDQLAKQASIIAKLNNQIDSLSGDMDQRTGTFIESLGALREGSFAAQIATLSASFMARNETFQNEDVIENAIAHQSMLIDNDIALYRFNKLLTLYPASTLRADSLLSIASIQRGKLKLYDNAAKTYQTLIEKHPDSIETQLGYEALATMYNEDMRDYPNAIKTYDAIVAKYKKDAMVYRSLISLEKIYELKTDQHDKAIDTYLRVADIFTEEQDGLNALTAAENIAINSTRNWVLAMSINDRINARAPNSEVAIQAVYSNADIMENKLGDKGKAKAMYEKFIKEYPSHALAKDAQKRVDAIAKKG